MKFTLIGIVLFLICAFSGASPAVRAEDLPQVMPNSNRITLEMGPKKIDMALSDLKKKLTSQTITLKDPIYNTSKTYDAFNLNDVMKLMGDISAADEIVFQSADGYAPSISMKKIKDHSGFLAYKEHARKDGKRWETFVQGKTRMTPAPYYLVWKDQDLGEEFPWPYQLVRIELVQFKEKYAKIFPVNSSEDSPQMKGFYLFKNECIRCHSLNLVGGDIGPELNSPKNVTEYWSEKTLRSFIKNPGTFREKDKMPAFPQLTERNLDEIISYFKHLDTHRR